MRTHVRFRAAIAIVCALALTTASFFPVSVIWVGAQTQSPATQTVFRTFAPYWQVNGGYSSTLIIRNTNRELAATLTPVIFTSGSKQSRLAPVVVPPDSVLSLPLAGALKESGISANWGALALEQSQAPPVTLLGEVRIENAEHSLIFNIPLHAGYVGGESKTLRGSWWLPDEETKGTIVLLNTSEKELVVHPVLRANWVERPTADILLKGHEMRSVDLEELLRENGLRGASTGSLSLVYEGPTNALLPSLLLFNEKSGFSLTGKFFPRQSSVPGQQTAWHFLAVFANSADPAMGFKQNLKFTPYALFANHTTQPMPLDLTAHFEIAGTGGVQSATLALSPLGGLETRLVDLSEFDLISKEVGFFSLSVTHPGPTGDLGVQIISMDKSRNFVFPAEGSTEVARSFNAISWDISGNQRSLVELQNVTENTVEARVTLTYTANGASTPGSYQLPAVSLPPHATRLVNLKDILATGQPDQEGNVVPPAVTFGTARVDVAGELSDGALVAVGTIFDPILGTCEGGSFCSNPPILVLIDGFETIRWEFFILFGAIPLICETLDCFGEPFIFTLTVTPAGGVRPSDLGLADTATITVQTSPAVSGQTVTLSASAVANSGGHSFHSGARPTGTFAATQGTTNSTGSFQTTYTAPIFGGTMIIQATMGSITKEQFLEVFIEGMQLLEAGANYNLVGPTTTHPDNHFGTITAVTNLPLIADDYKALFYPTSAIPEADKLKMNDMSLFNGGKFELAGNWCLNCPHFEHRLGTNCDLGSSNVPTDRWAALNGIFFMRNVQSVNDETACCNHWHLRF